MRKSLYFSPVLGRNEFLPDVKQVFSEDRFDLMLIDYEIHKGYKWELVKKHLLPDIVDDYEYVFIWDDDLDVNGFDAAEFLDIVRRNGLDVAQPALTLNSYYSHGVTLQHPGFVGRLTNFVEVMCPVYSAQEYRTIYEYIDCDNPWGWGYDSLYSFRKGIIDRTCVRHTRPVQSGRTTAPRDMMLWTRKRDVSVPHSFMNLGPLQ